MSSSKKIVIGGFDYLAVVMFAFCSALLLFRSLGVLPTIMADEWHYSLLSRLLPLSMSDDPGYLYLSLYKATSVCGGAYLDCARVLNVSFFALGCVSVYMTSRLFLPASSAIPVALIVLLTPESVYTVFFMPESLYFMLFWLFAYVVLRATAKDGLSWATVSVAGALLGAVSLVKPHALFIVAGMVFFIMTARMAVPDMNWRQRVLTASVFVGVVLAVKFAVGYLAVGSQGVTLFGARYSNMASNVIALDRIKFLIVNTAHIFVNHVTLLAFLYIVPLIGAIRLLASKGDRRLPPEIKDLLFFFILILGPLLVVTASFSASVAGTNPYDNLVRMHMRYYNFVMPMAVIVAALVTHYPSSPVPKEPAWLLAFAVLLCLVGAARISGLLGNLQINFVDSPGLMFLSSGSGWRWLVAIFGLALVLLMLLRFRLAPRLYLWLFLPLVFVMSSLGIQRTLDARKIPDTYDRAGAILAVLLSVRQDAQVTLIGPDEASLYKTMFYVDRPNSALRVVSHGGAIDPMSIPPNARYVLVFGDAYLEKSGFALQLRDGFSLYVKDDQ